MPLNWKISVTYLQHRLDINIIKTTVSMKGVFLVITLLISLCTFFSFVFAINSLTSLPINCFASMLTREFWILNYDWLTSISSHSNLKKWNILIFGCWALHLFKQECGTYKHKNALFASLDMFFSGKILETTIYGLWLL
jgi:hypothetical protein